jgi:predicted nucleic acid-binding protein
VAHAAGARKHEVIFVDANVFLRFLAVPATAEDVAMAADATRLFGQIARGQANATTSEATIAEVVYILTDRKHYGGPRVKAATNLRSLLLPPAFRLDTKRIVLRALELWESNPRISFPDGVAAAYSELRGYHLATFDSRLRKEPTVTLHLF